MTMKAMIFLGMAFLCTMTAWGQQYNTAGGLRLTRGAGLTVKQRIADQWTVEGIAMTDFQGNSDLVALGTYHGKIVFQKRLNWYAGAGLHTGYLAESGGTLGAAFVGGVEMTLGRVNVSFDYMPMVNFTQGPPVFEGNPGLSVRYVLVKRPKKKVVDRLKEGHERRKEAREERREERRNNGTTLRDRLKLKKEEQ